MKAILLCAGYATRLYPLTKDRPKHLLEVGGKPILSHVVDKITRLPLEGIYVVTNNKFYSHFETWRKEQYHGSIPLKVINDGTLNNDDRLGSMGDVEFVIRKEGIGEDLLMVNADNLFTFDLRPMYGRFLEKKNVVACYDVRDLEEAKKMGIPTLDEEDRIVHLEEKPENPSSTVVSIGIYFYSKEATALVKEYIRELEKQNKKPDTTGDFVGWVSSKFPVYAYTFRSESDRWVDIGTPDQYENVKESGFTT